MKLKHIYNYDKWANKEKFEKIIFKFIKIKYNAEVKIEESRRWIRLEKGTVSLVLNKILKAISWMFLFIIISQILRTLIFLLDYDEEILNFIKYDSKLFLSFLISCISIAGFLTALFFANLSGIFTSKYADISSRVSNELLNEYINQKYIDSIQNYIIVILITLIVNVLGYETDYILAIILVFLTIRIIIIFIELSKRVFVYSDMSLIGNTSSERIKDYFNKVQLGYYEFKKVSFKIHQRNQVLNNIQTIDDLSSSLILDNDIEGLNNLLYINIDLISKYSIIKNRITFNSLWFPEIYKHRIWFKENDGEIITRINTGTSMMPKLVKDYYFLENRLLEINQKIVKYFLDENRFENLYDYIELYHDNFNKFSMNGDYTFWKENLNSLTKVVLNDLGKYKSNSSEYTRGLFDLIATLQIDFILNFTNYFDEAKKTINNINLKKIDVNQVLKLNLKFLNNDKFISFINKLDNERFVEKELITSNEYINEYLYFLMNDEIFGYVRIFPEIIQNLNKVTQKVLNAGLIIESAVINSRIIELNNKISNIISRLEELHNNILENRMGNFKYNELDFEEIKNSLRSNYLVSIENFCNDTIKLYFLKYNLKEDQMDFVGQAYYQLTQLILELIRENDCETFQKIYPLFAVICTISGDYIRDIFPRDFNSNYILTKYTMTCINFMNISGFSIYYSHLTGNSKWENTVLDFLDKKDGKEIESFINLCKNCAEIYNQNFLSITLFDTSIKSYIERMVSDLIVKDRKYSQKSVQNNEEIIDILIKKFEFEDNTFTYEFFEIYMFYCINNYLESEKKYTTRYSWAERSN